MNIKIKQLDQNEIIQEIHNVTNYHKNFIGRYFITPIFRAYYDYCNKYFKNFLLKEGFTNDIKITVLWQKNLNSLAHVNSIEFDDAIEKNKPFIIHVDVSRFMSILKGFLKRYDNAMVTSNALGIAVNFNKEVIDALVHETVHLAQLILKTVRPSYMAIKLMDKDIRNDNQIIKNFIEFINLIHEENTLFLKMAKMEGEAMYFGQMYSFFSIDRSHHNFYEPSKYNKKYLFQLRRKDSKDKFTQDIKDTEIILREHLQKMRLIAPILKVSFELVNDITNRMIGLQENFATLSEKKLIENREYYYREEKILDVRLRELASKLSSINVAKSLSNDIKYEKGHLHKLGYVIVYALKQAKIHRYDMNANKMIGKFIGIKNIKEINNIKIQINELVKIIEDVEDIFYNFLKIIPRNEFAMERYYTILHKNSK